jgi:hypothetical protein
MAEERSNELEQRREELTRSLPRLSQQRADSYRVNSDAVARGRAGVKQEHPDEMLRLRDAEAAADTAIRDVQRELRTIDAEIEKRPPAGFGAKFGRALRRGR